MTYLKLSKLQLRNFRNLLPEVIEFSPGVNCIFGDNGNGKTNVLEAIYFLITRKSFRKNTGFPQYLSMEVENPEIYYSSVFKDIEGHEEIGYSGKIMPKSQTWHLNGKPSTKKIGTPIVFAGPYDSFAFHNKAEFRRSWIDQQLSLLSKDYKRSLGKYQTLLRHRNALLKKKSYDYHAQIQAIDEQMGQFCQFLTEERSRFLEELNKFLTPIFREIFSERHELKVHLESPFIGKKSSEITIFFQQKMPKDEVMGYTHSGIHRDDFTLLFDGINSYEFCSLGQQKMSYLSLIFAYIELFRYKFKTYPIVLLDDISGELDRHRWRYLVQYLNRKTFQVFITTANENFKQELHKLENARNFHISSGKVEKLQNIEHH